MRDSNNGHRVTVELNRSANDSAVTGEVAPPEAVAEHNDGPAIGDRVVVWSDGAAHCCPNAQGREIGAGNQLCGNLRHFITVADGYRGWEPAEHPGEDMIVVAQIFKHGPGNRICAVRIPVMVAGLSDDHEPLRMTDGQEPQNNLIQQTEHRRVGPNAQRQRQHRHCRKAGGFAQCAEGVARVLKERFEEMRAQRFADFFLEFLVAAEFDARAAFRFGAREAGAFEIIGAGLDVRAKLSVHVAVNARPAK